MKMTHRNFFKKTKLYAINLLAVVGVGLGTYGVLSISIGLAPLALTGVFAGLAFVDILVLKKVFAWTSLKRAHIEINARRSVLLSQGDDESVIIDKGEPEGGYSTSIDEDDKEIGEGYSTSIDEDDRLSGPSSRNKDETDKKIEEGYSTSIDEADRLSGPSSRNKDETDKKIEEVNNTSSEIKNRVVRQSDEKGLQ